MNGKRAGGHAHEAEVRRLIGMCKTKRLRVCDDGRIARECEFAEVNLTVVGGIRNPIGVVTWRVNVWGPDDYGVDRDFESYEEALSTYRGLPQPLTEAKLFELGFNVF